MCRHPEHAEGLGSRHSRRPPRRFMLLMPLLVFTPIIWTVLTWRRLKRLERDLGALQRQLAAEGAPGPAWD